MLTDMKLGVNVGSYPLVSIGLPTYNRPINLAQALQCLINQTYQNLEIIVSDNCSPNEEVEQLMRGIVKTDARIKYIRQDSNIGAIPNFNFVLEKATGKYFAWAADDDLCEKDFVEKLVNFMEKHPEVVLCGCDVQSIDENGHLLEVSRLDSIAISKKWTDVRALFFRYPTSDIFFCIYGLYKTDALRRCDLKIMSGWKSSGTNGEVPFLAKMTFWGKIAAIPEVLKTYTRHPDSIYHREVKQHSGFDVFMLRLIIRLKLFKIAFSYPGTLSTKIYLMHSIIVSFFSNISVTRIIKAILPAGVKRQLKKLCK